jgi:hypothetical protein
MSMKAFWRIALVLVVSLLMVSLLPSVARPWQDEAFKDSSEVFMRSKLSNMQSIIEGLTTEDLRLVAKSSQKISQLSLASQWQVIQTPDYVQRSSEFRRAADELTETARAENLDGATVAYLKVTLSCIECHKYVRHVRTL